MDVSVSKTSEIRIKHQPDVIPHQAGHTQSLFLEPPPSDVSTEISPHNTLISLFPPSSLRKTKEDLLAINIFVFQRNVYIE